MKTSCLLISITVLVAGAFATTLYGEDGVPRELTDSAKKTLEILKTEKIDLITLKSGEVRKGFEVMRDKLAKRGVTLRLKLRDGKEPTFSQPAPLALRNIPIDQFMKFFDAWSWMGWIIYPDGSITYMGLCGCCWTKDGIYCHDNQYEEGKPEAMAKELALQEAKKHKAVPAGTDQPPTKPAEKAPVKDQPSTPTSKDMP